MTIYLGSFPGPVLGHAASRVEGLVVRREIRVLVKSPRQLTFRLDLFVCHPRGFSIHTARSTTLLLTTMCFENPLSTVDVFS